MKNFPVFDSWVLLILLPQWVLRLKGHCMGVTWKFPPPHSSAILSASVQRSCREAVGEVLGKEGRRKEHEGREAAWKHFSWNITALGFIALPFLLLQLMDPCPSMAIWFPIYAKVWTSSDIKCGFRWHVQKVWVLSSACPPKMDDKHDEWEQMSLSVGRMLIGDLESWVLPLSRGPWPSLWSSVILTLFIHKMDLGWD